MSEQKFPARIWITNPDTDFLRMQNLGPQHEWLHLAEHQHLMAEKDKRIERLREALNNLMGYWDDPCRFDHNQNCQEHYSFNYDGTCSVADARAALQEE